MRQLAFLFLVVATICVVVPSVQAQNFDGYCGGGIAGGWGYGNLYNHLDYTVPYFAAHPPVYYSYPVARPYGYSPFAYPPGTRTPEVMAEPIEPATIINPYVEQPAQDGETPQDTAQEANDKVTTVHHPVPLVIINPYVSQRPSLVQVSD